MYQLKTPIFAINRLRFGTDGHGITTLVTFMKCPLKCKYCLNPQCHEPIFENEGMRLRKGIKMLTPQELYDIVKIDDIYFQATGGGICFGGGEPTLYPEFINEFKKLCGDKWKITLETCLCSPHKSIEKLNMVVDHWIVDVKSMNPNIYKKYTEMESDIRQQLWNLKVLVPDECVTIKVPVIPEYNDETSVDADIEEIKDIYDFPNVVKTYYKKL